MKKKKEEWHIFWTDITYSVKDSKTVSSEYTCVIGNTDNHLIIENYGSLWRRAWLWMKFFFKKMVGNEG